MVGLTDKKGEVGEKINTNTRNKEWINKYNAKQLFTDELKLHYQQ